MTNEAPQTPNNQAPPAEATQASPQNAPQDTSPQRQQVPSQSQQTSFSPDALPEELRNEPSLRNFDDVGKLAKSYVHLVKKLGAPAEQLMRLPSGPDGNWDEVYNQLGRPADPTGYDINSDDFVTQEYVKNAHQLGLSKKQAREVYGWMSEKYKEIQNMERDQYREQTIKGISELRREWGNDFDAQTKIARQAFLQLADADTVKAMEETGLGNNPQMIKLFNRVGQILQEDGLLQNDVAFGDSGGRASIQEKLSEIMKDGSPYWDGQHRDHDRYVAEALKLRELLT